MFRQQVITLVALSGLLALGQTEPPKTPGSESVNLQAVLQRLADLDKQNEDLRKKILALEQNQAKQEADVAAVKTAAATSYVAAVSSATPPSLLTKAANGIQIKPYGYVKFDAAYDTARTAWGDAAFFVYPTTYAGGDKKELTFGARESRLGANIIAPEQNGIKITGRIEGDLYENVSTENSYTPRLRLAYLDAAWGDGWSVRAGQDWDTYVSVLPKENDAAILGYTGNLYGRHPQVRLTKVTKLSDSTQITTKFAVQDGRNGSDIDKDSQADENAAAVPNLHASAALQTKLLTDKFSTFALSGAYGREKLSGTTNPGNYDSLLVHGGVLLPITQKFSLQGTLWAGENVDNYLGGIGQGINATDGTEVQAYGGWAQGIYDFNKKWSVSLGYGFDNPDDADLAGDARTLNERLFTNVFYKLTDAVTLSAEYSYFTTSYALTDAVTDNRIQLGAQYSF